MGVIGDSRKPPAHFSKNSIKKALHIPRVGTNLRTKRISVVIVVDLEQISCESTRHMSRYKIRYCLVDTKSDTAWSSPQSMGLYSDWVMPTDWLRSDSLSLVFLIWFGFCRL